MPTCTWGKSLPEDPKAKSA